MGASKQSTIQSSTARATVQDRLLKALAEEVKLPLLQIARQAELGTQADAQELLGNIELSATQALWFVDGYLLSQQLALQQTLELEPVAISSVLQDTAQRLGTLAKQYDVEVAVDYGGNLAPVMAHRQALQTALLGLGSILITANSNSQKRRSHLILAAHRSRGGIVAGVFSPSEGLSQTVYQKGRSLYGRARQPLQEFTAQAGTGVFVAEALLDSMNAQLRVARHHKLTGLAATMQPSRQLAMV